MQDVGMKLYNKTCMMQEWSFKIGHEGCKNEFIDHDYLCLGKKMKMYKGI
jgi:hypothetical protein